MRLLVFLLVGIIVLITPLSAQQPAPISKETPNAPQRLEPGKVVARDLKSGEIHSYTIAVSKGQHLEATANQEQISLLVRLFAPNGDTLTTIDSYQTNIPISFDAKTTGDYRIDVFPFDKNSKPGRYEIKINEILSAEAHAKRLSDILRRQKAMIDWSKSNAIPLKTVEAGNGFTDLQPLKQMLGKVQFVGLGEATHGTREFFQMKHRLLEFLLREMGFCVFAMEASYAGLHVINEYVMRRGVDGPKALEDQGLWNWNTQEVLAMMDWARRYNAGVTADERVKFSGIDIQYNQSGKDKLLDYLRRVAPERFAATKTFFQVNLDSLSIRRGVAPERFKENLNKLRALKTNYDELLVFFESNQAFLSGKTSQAEYEQMHKFARVLVQYTDCFSQTDQAKSRGTRDRYMAENFKRLISQEPPGTRAVIWAHNDHITKDANSWMPQPLGLHLRHAYGDNYYALGFSTNGGTFQAREARPKNETRPMVMSYTLNPAPDGSADWLFAQTRLKNFILDLRSGTKSADVNAWLSEPHLMRSRGSTFDAAFEPVSFLPYTLSKVYDGLLFIETTTRARPNPSVKDVAP